MIKFNILKIVLWLKNGNRRTLNFESDKVNVITGHSNTGKTAILDIIDYCFFASSMNISDSVINENVEWYGVSFQINDKFYTLAREHYNRNVSNKYYFSSIGEIPKSVPIANNTEKALKLTIETEFSINSNTTIAYGGNQLKQDSKISLRFFLMFNTISQDIITESRNIFFDKQHDSRYREALPRIFDIATGIESIENILLKEKKVSLEKEIKAIDRKRDKHNKLEQHSHDEIRKILFSAREMALISSEEDEVAIGELKDLIESKKFQDNTNIGKREELVRNKNLILRKIRNLNTFSSEYSIYKKNLSALHDSLKPIDYLNKNVEIRTLYFNDIIKHLSYELNELKKANSKKTPIDKQVVDEISNLNEGLRSIELELDKLPKYFKISDNDEQKLIFIGRATEILKLYSNEDKVPENLKLEIDRIQEDINSIIIENTEESMSLTIDLIEEVIRDYILKYGEVLGNYSTYQPKFNYKDKALQLRRPHSSKIEPSVGSSSNHMFLHLFLSLAIHEVIFLNEAPYVPPFLVIDQPSRPYFEDNGSRKIIEDIDSDNYKIKKAFVLLNDFIENRLQEDGHFQMIIFEHVSPDFFEDLEHFYLVEEFRNGNALIPEEMLN
ncbi:DUF3732 domain-containing protein [Psychrobacter sp. S1-30-MNA-CIBAN-0213]|uniref:DUF3732 domain-containing protein n=1 Tax=unclassified Psychrobacter TaxID=196806 RepID=UPI0033328EDE